MSTYTQATQNILNCDLTSSFKATQSQTQRNKWAMVQVTLEKTKLNKNASIYVYLHKQVPVCVKHALKIYLFKSR